MPVAGPAVPAPARLARVPAADARPAGFALYVGLDHDTPGVDIPQIVADLRALLGRLAPGAESYASVVVAPPGAGRSVDVVRSTLRPSAGPDRQTARPAPERPHGVVVDLARRRVQLDGETAPLTFLEYALLHLLVTHEGKTVTRAQIVSALAAGRHGTPPNERTVDVHVRRLRAKLGAYEDIVRTVRGVGYRFDRHADVTVRPAD